MTKEPKTPKQKLILDTYRHLGSIKATSKEIGCSRSTVRRNLQALGVYEKPLASGSVSKYQKVIKYSIPKSGVSRFIITSAQNNTWVDSVTWKCLLNLAEYYSAKIFVSRFTYNKASYGKKSVKPDKEPTVDDFKELWYDPKIEEYIVDKPVKLAPGLLFCGEMNILPTAVRPLSGMATYTDGNTSCIFPHVKQQLESVATAKHSFSKLMFTTGTVTQLNYIQKKSGLKAENLHCYGALIVEVNSQGDWWVRQLQCDNRGNIYDLNLRADFDGVTVDPNSLEAITWGDVHADQIDDFMMKINWGEEGILDTLRPKTQFIHDIFDSRRRNHHIKKDHHKLFELFHKKQESVADEVELTANILKKIHRPWCETVIVNSNHDNHLLRWLKEADYRNDPVNAEFFLEAQLELYKSLKKDDKDFHLIQWALGRFGCPEDIVFLHPDESYLLLDQIECGYHGDIGPNGVKGSPQSFVQLGQKLNIAHFHGTFIRDNIYVAGTNSNLDLGYNHGPSNWSHSDILTYVNGKRTIITKRKYSKTIWRAEPLSF